MVVSYIYNKGTFCKFAGIHLIGDIQRNIFARLEIFHVALVTVLAELWSTYRWPSARL